MGFNAPALSANETPVEDSQSERLNLFENLS